MTQVRDRAIDAYTMHYARVNPNIDPRKVMTPRKLKRMSAEYGKLIAPLPAQSKVLDLGCGTGFLLYWLATQQNVIPYGVDESRMQVDVAKASLPTCNIACTDGLSYLRQNPNTFSAIFCMDVLEHLPSLDLCLEWLDAVYDALLPNGFFFCRVPNAANLAGVYARYADLTHERLFASTSLLQLLEMSQLEDCRIVPIKASSLSRRIRMPVEHFLHKIIFLLCAHPFENVFTSNVCAIGYRRD